MKHRGRGLLFTTVGGIAGAAIGAMTVLRTRGDQDLAAADFLPLVLLSSAMFAVLG